MNRLTILAFLLAACADASSPRIPISIDRMNGFSDEYNRYVQELHGGVVDLKQCERVERAWKSMRAE